MKFSFRGTVSSCFEPHLGSYVDLEEKTLMESLEKLIQVSTSAFRRKTQSTSDNDTSTISNFGWHLIQRLTFTGGDVGS